MNATDHKPVIGLVGGIGGGKSFVAALLVEYGGRLIDADRIGHEALKQAEVRGAVVARWGPQVLEESGEISRRKLGLAVFGDPSQRRELEAIVFPWIGGEIRRQLDRAQAEPGTKFVVLDAAIMLETGWDRACDRVMYVHTPRARRLARVAAQRGWDDEELSRRESAQWPVSVKEGRADRTLDNSGPPEQLREQVEALLNGIETFPNP